MQADAKTWEAWAGELAEAQASLARLREENERLKAAAVRALLALERIPGHDSLKRMAQDALRKVLGRGEYAERSEP